MMRQSAGRAKGGDIEAFELQNILEISILHQRPQQFICVDEFMMDFDFAAKAFAQLGDIFLHSFSLNRQICLKSQ